MNNSNNNSNRTSAISTTKSNNSESPKSETAPKLDSVAPSPQKPRESPMRVAPIT